MKKRIMAVLTSILMGTSICGAFPVQAEDTDSSINYGTGLKFETPEEFAERTDSEIKYGSSNSLRTATNLPSSVDLSTSAFFHPLIHKEVLTLALLGHLHTTSLLMK